MTEKKEKKKKSVTSETIDAARVAGQMFEDGDRTYVRFRMVDHYEVWPLQSVEARTWLAGVAHGVADAWVTATLKGIADLLDGLVRVEGNKTPVHIRVARKGDAVYLDLGTDDWTCVKVTADGWEIIPHPEGGPYFYRPKRLQPLPTPKSGGHLEELLAPYIHVSETDMRLVVACMVDALKGREPYVVLAFIGGAGSSKSSAAKAYISAFDPSRSRSRTGDDAGAPTSLKMRPRTERDFPPMVGHSHVLGLDNLSFIEDWLSDALCVVATGGDVAERALYLNFEEASISVASPVVLNGIESLVTRGDLTQRTIRLDVLPMADEDRLEEVELWGRFQTDHPAILGSLLDTLSVAMREHPAVTLERLPRMADFARWGVAVERALGWPEGSFMKTYEANQENAVAEMLSGDSFTNVLIAFIRDENSPKREWTGTASELLGALQFVAGQLDVQRGKDWPTTPRAVTGRLQRLEAALPQFGMKVTWTPPNRNSIRTMTITDVWAAAASSSDPPHSQPTHHEDLDVVAGR